MAKIDSKTLGTMGEEGFLREWIEDFQRTGEPRNSYELRKIGKRERSGETVKKNVWSLADKGLIYPAIKLERAFVPDPEDETLDEQARRESVSSLIASLPFEIYKQVLKALPSEVASWMPAPFPCPPLPSRWLLNLQ